MIDLPLRLQLSDDDFLTFDGPTGVVVAPDDSRQNFFHHLGLREDIYRHKMIYRKMKREAQAGMGRLFASRQSLRSEIAEDDSVVAPYNVGQISEVAFQEEVEMIFESASQQTLSWYTMMDTGDGKNWVIRWMLWRVLQKAEAGAIKEESSGSDTDTSCALTTATTAADGSSVRTDARSPPFPSPTWPTIVSSPQYSENEGANDDCVTTNFNYASKRKRSASEETEPADQRRKVIKPVVRGKCFLDENDNVDQRPHKAIKQEHDSAADAASPSRSSDFWSRVLNT